MPYKSLARIVGSCPTGDRCLGRAIPDRADHRNADPLFERFPEANPVRRGNVMARLRMIVLYDQSEAFRGWWSNGQ